MRDGFLHGALDSDSAEVDASTAQMLEELGYVDGVEVTPAAEPDAQE